MSESTDAHVDAKLKATENLTDHVRILQLLPLAKLRKSWLWHALAVPFAKASGDRGGYYVPLSERWMLLVAVDMVCVLIAFWGANFLSNLSQDRSPELWYWLPIILMGWWLLAQVNDLYDIRSSSERLTSVVRLVGSGLISLMVYLVLNQLFPDVLPGLLFYPFLIIALILLIFWRLMYASLWHRLLSPHRLLIIDFADRGQPIAQLLGPTGRSNYEILGYVDNDPTLKKQYPADIPLLGQVADLPRLVQSFRVHELVVAMKQSLTDELVEILIACQSQGVQVSWMPDLYERMYRSVPIQYIDNSWALSAIQGKPIFNRLQLIGKRCLDLTIIVGALPMLLVVMPLIALAIYLDSPGPVFYQQTRVGRGGKHFTIFKFRTMISDAEKNSTPQWAAKNDPRITRTGRLLRKMRLDELPQMLNILRGEMSFVGPRPERPEFVAELEREIPFYRTRLLIKPGLTGWAQIHYGYGNSVEDAVQKLQFDFYYIHHWSLWKDIYILFRTFAVVFQFKGT